MKSVLLAGETFSIVTTVATGYSVMTSASFGNGATRFAGAMASGGIDLRQLGAERCAAEFPTTLAELAQFSVVVLSDVGALALLISPDTRSGTLSVNRLELLHDWVSAGGGLMMAGGYSSFQGMDGAARYCDTAVEDCLPIRCLPYADGVEAPQGLEPAIVTPGHAITDGIPVPIPPVLGFNRVVPRTEESCQHLLALSHRGKQFPLLSVKQHGRGRAVAWTTDIGNHWLTQQFLGWSHYDFLMQRMVQWAAGDIT